MWADDPSAPLNYRQTGKTLNSKQQTCDITDSPLLYVGFKMLLNKMASGFFFHGYF